MNKPLLIADQLQADPRIAQAKALLAEALSSHQAALTAVRPPRDELRVSYAQLIDEFSRQRGGALYFPYLGSGMGNGALVELADGSVKYDMISGIGVHPLGHSDPRLLADLVDAVLADTVMQGNLQQNRESQQLCAELVDLASQSGAALSHCFLTTSGAMANENALKMLLQKRAPARRLLAFGHAFAGRTLALSSITDKAAYRVGLPDLLAVDYVPFCDAAAPEQSLLRTLAALHAHVSRHPGGHAGMVLELIQGEGGYRVAPREFLAELCAELRRCDIPIWFDEVQTFGRTSRPFAFQHFGLDEFADVVTIGKMTQVCATLFRDEFRPQPGLVSQTFTGATASIFAARHILQRLRTDMYSSQPARPLQIHDRFRHHFERLQSRWPDRIQGPWGLGGMVAFTACEGDAKASKDLLMKLFEAGVIAFVAGEHPTRIRMLPPVAVVTDSQIDQVCGIIEKCLE